MKSDEPCLFCQTLDEFDTSRPVRTAKDALIYLEHSRAKKQEYLICLTLGGDNKLLKRRIVTLGLLDTALAHPREIYAGAIADRAASVIIAHNHPSGDSRPSSHDIKMTQQIYSAGQILGIPLRDHIVIGVSDHYSFKQRGMI